MVLSCCVPSCDIDIWQCDPSLSFHEFPSDPELSAKWIKQINTAAKPNLKHPWLPKEKSVICSRHFLQTDFKDDTDTLKPNCIPTVFGHKYIGFNQYEDGQTSVNGNKKSPLIVKVTRPQENESNLKITSIYSEALETSNGTAEACPSNSEVPRNETSLSALGSLQSVNHKMGASSNQSFFTMRNNVSPKTPVRMVSNTVKDSAVKKNNKRKVSLDNNLIEIGPNTFLKINPEIIKVNKKQTPAGNTVLQFVMNQKMANSNAAEMLPTLIQSVTNTGMTNVVVQKKIPSPVKETEKFIEPTKKDTVVEHVLGHLVDTHVCKDNCEKLDGDASCEDMVLDESESICPGDTNNPGSSSMAEESLKIPGNIQNGISPEKSNSNVLTKAPVFITTDLPLSHCMMDKPKYMAQLRQKSRQVAALKIKIASLTKKVEELEDRCIVQERQLSYSFIKRLKAIRKNASNGDPCATYILEQIRCYSGKSKMRWSDSTLSQCAVWCRKAPYAYEYFKKADFFKLPCLGTVKRYMKKHPELKLQSKSNSANPDDDDSSSDFDFDESDSGNDPPENSDMEKMDPSVTCETVLGDAAQTQARKMTIETSACGSSVQEAMDQTDSGVPENDDHDKSGKLVEMSAFPVDASSLEVQEIVLPSGEVVQCYSSGFNNTSESGNQYYIIPNVGDQNSGVDHEYNVVHSGESLPVILQNLEHAQLPMQQEQLIFITNSADQVECSETEVITA